MSKGHCSGALYATLAGAGILDDAALQTFMDPLSMLNGHPDRNKVPGVEANTGPLGHGLANRSGLCAGGKDGEAFVAHLVLAGRRGTAGGQQLGGGYVRSTVQAR